MSAQHTSYDVVIVGGAIYGSSVAWWLSQMSGFDGRILVVERDPTYEFAATSHTNSCIRQQFSNPVNIAISQFGAEFIRGFQDFMGNDPDVPKLAMHCFGYLYLADTEEFAKTLQDSQQIQQSLGAATRFMTRDEIAAAYPFYNLEGITGANHNLVNEGYFDGGTMFDWFRRMARRNGVEYIQDEVVAMNRQGSRVRSVVLKSGGEISCGTLVNATGTRGAASARMAGLDIPVEARRRYTYIFDAAEPLGQDLPLTIDPSGVHFRTDGRYYMAGGHADEDPAVDPDDFDADHSLWEEKFWPIIATRVPAFERVRVINMWVGHYDYNTFDQNAIVGPHPEVDNFMFLNGFSGHGLQQSPALGRGLAEIITTGEYRSIDLSAFSVNRVLQGEKFPEKAVI
ncbi:FAD-binding oxidoreductase [uncultured Roseobacter sp.]|uniref:NAD(P)/FAD-dependent oxidoreductase n=1 Tax=uncultured Roseobacter sp. TaxID=114847 RepID=UPI0026077D47|nr:FAD-binding oxidoreductase [uncultured Roseobacter sp.]